MRTPRRLRPHIVRRGRLSLGHDAVFEVGPIRTHLVVERSGAVRIGDNVRIGFGSGIACESAIDIGDDVVLGPYTQLLDTAFHVTNSVRDSPAPRPIVIESGVVLGPWTMVLPGAHIDAGSIVPAGTVVTARRR